MAENYRKNQGPLGFRQPGLPRQTSASVSSSSSSFLSPLLVWKRRKLAPESFLLCRPARAHRQAICALSHWGYLEGGTHARWYSGRYCGGGILSRYARSSFLPWQVSLLPPPEVNANALRVALCASIDIGAPAFSFQVSAAGAPSGRSGSCVLADNLNCSAGSNSVWFFKTPYMVCSSFRITAQTIAML